MKAENEQHLEWEANDCLNKNSCQSNQAFHEWNAIPFTKSISHFHRKRGGFGAYRHPLPIGKPQHNIIILYNSWGTLYLEPDADVYHPLLEIKHMQTQTSQN